VHVLVITKLLANSNSLLASFELWKVLGPLSPLLWFNHEVDKLFSCNITITISEMENDVSS
jgi:hypothetical protein